MTETCYHSKLRKLLYQDLSPSEDESENEDQNEDNPVDSADHPTRQMRYIIASLTFLLVVLVLFSKFMSPKMNTFNPCFGAEFTEWSKWSECVPFYNCDSEMNPNNPRKCPEKTRDRRITWPLNHTPNPDCNGPLIEHDSSECNCDKCIYRLHAWTNMSPSIFKSILSRIFKSQN